MADSSGTALKKKNSTKLFTKVATGWWCGSMPRKGEVARFGKEK